MNFVVDSVAIRSRFEKLPVQENKAMSLGPNLVSVNKNICETLGRIAVVDIGSNTVRLVVYDTPTRLPIPIFNEKSECGLVSGLNETGRLNPAGVVEAMRSLQRFRLLSKSMNVEKISLIATAAVREASDGSAFVKRIFDSFGIQVRILSGEEEARLSGYGLLSGRRLIDGLVADIGGGSVDLVEVGKGEFGRSCTLPLGHLRLREQSGGSGLEANRIVSEALIDFPWLACIKGRNLFLAGGGCRALARVFIAQANYPLHVVDGYKIRRGDASRLCNVITGMGVNSRWGLTDISKERLSSLPFVASVVGGLLDFSKAKKAVFSGFGMREGQLLEMLPEAIRDQDPLLAGCAAMAERTGRISMAGREIYDWISPIFPKKRDADSRIRMAACMLSDIGWSEHPDYRAEHTFYRVLRLPFAGLSHADRAFLAFSLFFRYMGDPNNSAVSPINTLLNNDELVRTEVLGCTLCLAYTLIGAAPTLLHMTSLELTKDELILNLKGRSLNERQIFTSEAVDRTLTTLARVLGLKARIA